MSTIQKAIGTGCVSTLPTGQIDSDVADEEWSRNTQTHAPAVDRRGQADKDGEVFGASQYTKARDVREHYQARLAKIEHEEPVAKLAPGDEVQVAAYNKFQQFRDAMLELPTVSTRCSPPTPKPSRCMKFSRSRSGRP